MINRIGYSFADIVDIEQLQDLTDLLYTATGIPCGIVDLQGEMKCEEEVNS